MTKNMPETDKKVHRLRKHRRGKRGLQSYQCVRCKHTRRARPSDRSMCPVCGGTDLTRVGLGQPAAAPTPAPAVQSLRSRLSLLAKAANG